MGWEPEPALPVGREGAHAPSGKRVMGLDFDLRATSAALGAAGIGLLRYDRANGLRLDARARALLGGEAPADGVAEWLAARTEGDALVGAWEPILAGDVPELRRDLRVALEGGARELRLVASLHEGAVVGTLQAVEPAEALRRKAERSEQRFRAIYENAPVMIDAFRPDGGLVLWNRECERVLGYTADEVKACDDPMELFYPDPETREAVFATIVNPDGQFRELQVRTRHGMRAQRWANFALPEGEIISVGYDVTDLRVSHDQLARSNRELEEFAYVASHDLQEPLRMVRSYVTLLEEEYGDRLDEEGRTYMAYAVDGARRMQALVHDLLAYSRVQNRELELESVDLGEVLADVAAEVEPARLAADGEIGVGPLPTVIGDRGQLHRLFLNLVSNALKFRRPGEPPRVSVQARRDGERWRVEVRDEGIGFDPAQAERAFGMFQRLNKRSEYEGTGIGLAICRQIALRHGGAIGVETERGKGSTFWVLLPDSPA